MRDPHSRKVEYIEFCKILKFDGNGTNIEQDTAI